MKDTGVLAKEELVEQHRQLIEKWQPFLEGTAESPLVNGARPVTDNWDAYVMARLLESAQKECSLMEDVATTSVFGSNYISAVLGLIRQTFPRLQALNLVAAQPLDRPSGKVFYLDVKRSDGTYPGPRANPASESRSIEQLGSQWLSYRDWASKGENEFIDKEVSLEITSDDVSVSSQKLKYRYTVELQQDLAAYHGLDAAAILQGASVDELARELDARIINTIRGNVGAGTVTYGTKVPAGYTFSEWRTRLNRAILNASSLIEKFRMLPATWIIAGTNAVNEMLDVGNIDTSGQQPVQSANAIRRVGVWGGMLDVFHVPYLSTNEIILGRRGNGFEDAGLIFLPYVLLFVGERVYDAKHQRYVRSLMSRYDTSVVGGQWSVRRGDAGTRSPSTGSG